MMKSKVTVIVESVEDAVKFYTEKLAFDLINVEVTNQDPALLASATFRKGKFFVTFRRPRVEEFAAFSFIKRCASRCISVSVDLKRDVERFFKRCLKKNIKVIKELSPNMLGLQEFVIRDPFGLEITFVEKPEVAIIPARPTSLCGITINPQDMCNDEQYCSQKCNQIIEHLRELGIVRRAAKKLVKSKLKEFL